MLRRRQNRTQAEHARRAGIGRWAVVEIERAALDRLRLADIERSFDSLACRIKLDAYYRGAAAERLLDEAHALLVGAFLEVLRRYGWEVRVEASFSEWGERGSIDILAWHAGERALLVVEVKSELSGLDVTLRPLDVKTRLAPTIARR
jgi:DNA-binding XRE family transcriptional regulator